MELNEFNEVDYLEEARNRYTWQFRDKIVFDKYVEWLLSEAKDLQIVFRDLVQLRSIDTAEGEQLDIIGRIVGQERIAFPNQNLPFFGFQGATNAHGFDEGIWLSNSPSDYERVPDSIYRLLIRSRILKNSLTPTPEGVIQAVQFIFGTDSVFIQELPHAHAKIFIGRELNALELFIVNSLDDKDSLIPFPIGVGIEIATYVEEQFFAFQGVRGAKGFGSYIGEDISMFSGSTMMFFNGQPISYFNGNEVNPNVGGYFASYI